MAQAPMRYEWVADRLRTAIRDGTFAPGSRLPGLRRACDHYGVSLSTALQAYRQLEAEGLIDARARSGYFVQAPPCSSHPEPQATELTGRTEAITVSARVLEMISASQRPGCVNLGATLPDPALLPTRALRRMLAEAAAAPSSIGSYGSIAGDPALRELIAQHMMLIGVRTSPDEIVTTNGGCMEALSVALRTVTRPGDTVAVESPTFYGLLQVLEDLGLRALELPTDPRTGLDPRTAPALAQAAGARALVTIPNAHNPLGYSMPDSAKKALVDCCAEAALPLIEDDIYGELAPEQHRPAPLKAWDEHGAVMLCSSFSKVLSPGLRVGWLLAGRQAERATEIKFRSSGTAAIAPQRALAEYLRRGRYDRVVRNAARHYAARLDRLRAHVAAHFPAGTRISRPVAGFALWVELPTEADATAIYQQALDQDIVIAPGELFAPADRYRHCLRLNAAAADDSRVPPAIEVLGRLVHQAL